MCGKEHIAEQQLCKVVLCKAIILVCLYIVAFNFLASLQLNCIVSNV